MAVPMESSIMDAVDLPGAKPMSADEVQLAAAQAQTLTEMRPDSGDQIGGAIAGPMIAFADTLATSLHVTSEGDVQNYLNEHFPTMGQMYAEHRQGYGLVGDLGGALLPATLAAKTVRVGSWLERFAAGKGIDISGLLSTGKTATQLSEAAMTAAREAKMAGTAVNLERTSVPAIKRATMWRKVGDSLIESVAADAAIGATMHSSNTLFPQDFTVADNLAFFGVVDGLIAGATGVAVNRKLAQAVQEGLRSVSLDTRNMRNLPLSSLVRNVANERGPAAGMIATWMQDVETRIAKARELGDNDMLDAALSDKAMGEKHLKELTVQMFRDSPIPGITKAVVIPPMAADANPLIKTMQDAYKFDPSIGVGLRSLEPFDAQLGATFYDKISSRTESLRAQLKDKQAELDLSKSKKPFTQKAADAQLAKQNRIGEEMDDLRAQVTDLEKHAGLVVELDGSTTPLTNRANMFQDGDRVIKRDRPNASTSVLDRQKQMDLVVGDNGQIIISPRQKDLSFNFDATTNQFTAPRGQKITTLNDTQFTKLSYLEQTQTFDTMQHALENVNIQTWGGMRITKDSPMTQIDFALGMLEKHGDAAAARITGIKDPSQLMMLSLEKKFNIFQTLRNKSADAFMAGVTDEYHDLNNIARALNLPANDSPLVHLFARQVGVSQGKATFAGFAKDLGTLRAGLEDTARDTGRYMFTDPQAAMLDRNDLRGTMMNMPRDRKPVLAVMRNVDDPLAPPVENLNMMNATNRAVQSAILRGNADATLVNAVMNTLDVMKDQVMRLKQETPDLVHGNVVSPIWAQAFEQQRFRFRDQPGFRNAMDIADATDKAAEKEFENNILKPRQAAINALRMRGAEADLNQFMVARHSYGAGWELNTANPFAIIQDPVSRETLYQPVLDVKSAKNRQIWQQMFGEEMPTGKELRMPVTNQRTPVTLTKKALDAWSALSELSDTVRVNLNQLRASQGLPEIKGRFMHLPTAKMSDKFKMFIVDAAGRNKGVVTGTTEKEALAQAKLVQEAAERNGESLGVVTEQDIMNYADARGVAYHTMDDFTNPLNQTGASKGKAFIGPIVTGPDAYQAMVETTLNQAQDIARRTREIMFQPELDYLRMQKDASRLTANPVSGRMPRTSYDELAMQIRGVQNLDPDSVPGIFLRGVERIYDGQLAKAFDRITMRATGQPTGFHKAVTQQVNDRMIDAFHPFQNMLDFAEKTNVQRAPSDLYKHASALNNFVAATAIRMFDVGMMATNMLSLTATLPVVVNMLKPMPGESEAARLERIGIFSTQTPEGLSYFSTSKALVEGTHYFFSEDAKRIRDIAVKKGFFDQSAAETQKVYGETGTSFLHNQIKAAVDKASYLTDTSERLARAISFMTFFRMANKGMGLSEDAAMVWAHSQANKVIADFRPANKPVMFQGAAGMPLGLFTTYMWNYLHRFQDLIELGDKRNLALQAGLQTSLFGAESMPGWNEFLSHFMSNYDGTDSPVDRLNRGIGTTATDVLLNGAISHFSGISVGPRNAVGLPFARGLGAQTVPGIQEIQRIGQVMGKTIDSMVTSGRVEPGRIAEIVAQSGLNKGLSNAIELFQGRALDYNDNIIENDTRTKIGIAARLLGFKPLFADESRQEFARERATDKVHEEMKNRLGDNIKYLVRSKNLTADTLETALAGYVQAKGKPENFERYVRQQAIRGTVDYQSQHILEAVKQSSDANRISRLLNLYNQSPHDNP